MRKGFSKQGWSTPPGRSLEAGLDAPADVDIVRDHGGVRLREVANVAWLATFHADGFEVATSAAGVAEEDGTFRLVGGLVDEGPAW